MTEAEALKCAIGAVAAAAMESHNRGDFDSETAWNETADVLLAMIAAREPNRPQGENET